ncbi:acyl-CoA-binding domain-containing protein 6 isoform X4 [Diceros bicornis minor]|uniref:acyl-CoA-binding domain-containing protein 6 isoform X4 n=1 Tax=Diceros bicornis minor TaxID=77932 RepID=UPI0026EE338C|nr:acyl-CoA-binding domain-containing protein 6 isoform X4 [Diceros bicornis minor]
MWSPSRAPSPRRPGAWPSCLRRPRRASRAWFRWPAGSSSCTCTPGTSRSKLGIAILLNQASLILKESKNGKPGKPLVIQAPARQCRSISQWLRNWIQAGILREEDKNIFDYCRENNIDHISKVIKSKNVDVNMKDEEGRALLHWACDRGHKELVTVLLQYRADINCQDNEGQTALHYVTTSGASIDQQKDPLHSTPESLRKPYIYTSEDGWTGPHGGGGTRGTAAVTSETGGFRNCSSTHD